MPDRLAGTFRKPFPEQVAAFRARLGNLVPTATWNDLAGQAHDSGFMVAGAVKADLIEDLAKAVDKSISEGTSLEEFRRDFRDIVTKRGWHNWTGEGTRRGEAWRTRIIYKTNASTTYAAGRRAQLIEGGFEYWVYRHGGSLDPRIEHLGWDGLALEPSHVFWITHSPQNGWGCSCYVVGARSLSGIRRVGGDPNKKLPANWNRIDPKTGIQVGIDKGWNHAHGATAIDTILTLRDKLDKLPERPSIDLVQSFLETVAFSNWLKSPIGNWPLARISQRDADLIGSKNRVVDIAEATAKKQLIDYPDLTAENYRLAQIAIDKVLRPTRAAPRKLVYVYRGAETDGKVIVVHITRSSDGLRVEQFQQLDERDLTDELRNQLRGGA